MKRKDFIKIIKLRSAWKVDRRKGNYILPSGERLSDYIESLVDSQLQLDNLAVGKDGNLYFSTNENGIYKIVPPFKNNEKCDSEEMGKRIKDLINEILY